MFKGVLRQCVHYSYCSDYEWGVLILNIGKQGFGYVQGVSETMCSL